MVFVYLKGREVVMLHSQAQTSCIGVSLKVTRPQALKPLPASSGGHVSRELDQDWNTGSPLEVVVVLGSAKCLPWAGLKKMPDWVSHYPPVSWQGPARLSF